MNKTARNERRKLIAAYFNGIAMALMAVGVFAPVAAYVQNGSVSFASVILGAGCASVSIALHQFALHSLRSMEE